MSSDVNRIALRRLLASQTLWGRSYLSAHLLLQKLRSQYLAYGGDVLKRAFDIVVSLVLLILLSPFLALIGLAVWTEDGGKIFFPQTRVGRYGKLFTMYKIRSMCADADQRLKDLLEKNQLKEGVTFKIKDDPRMTRVGKWLRKYSFDELPQLYNVLIGDMSLVGPRPPVPREVAMYRPSDRRRLAAKPGITCVWQISGRSEIDFSGQVGLDVGYIESQSFWTDLKILVRTVPAVLSGKGAC
jgi:lipopolysaccharide/colanic/teichoic acid biosynthesis glycosyltransferase